MFWNTPFSLAEEIVVDEEIYTALTALYRAFEPSNWGANKKVCTVNTQPHYTHLFWDMHITITIKHHH